VPDTPADAVDQALAKARELHRPVLLSFQSVSCDACYYLDQHVRSTPEWSALKGQAVAVELDADSGAGDRRVQQWQVHQLPTTLVLDAQGRELGRLSGVQTHSDYLRDLRDVLARTLPVDDLPGRVTDTRAPAIAAAREYLAALYARDDADRALHWWDGLAATLRQALDHDPQIHQWVLRLRLMQASQLASPAQCVAAAPPVLALDLGCDRPYEVKRTMDCTADLPQAQRQQLLGQQKVQLAQFAYSRAFVGKRSCADGRSAVLAVSELDQMLGYPKAAGAILAAAIDDANHRLRGDLHRDRALADDLRAYLDHAGRLDELDALYPKLIAAFPNDPVYEYRYARSLVSRGHAELALPHFERAVAVAAGRFRLVIAQEWVQVLIKLGRAQQAKGVVDSTLQANGLDFPDQAAKLRALVANAS
jgi:tetratricopeptide (TPR) repeat protein